MSGAEFSQALENIGFLTYIRESGYTYPIIMATHLASIAVFGGMILMTDLRLLDVAMRERPASDVIRQLRPWKWLGFCIIVTCGLLLATSEMLKYYANPYFLLKMTCLLLVGVHALVFRGSVYGPRAEIDRGPRLPSVAKAAGLTSLILWISIASLGRWIAYYEPPKANRKPPATAITLPRHPSRQVAVSLLRP